MLKKINHINQKNNKKALVVDNCQTIKYEYKIKYNFINFLIYIRYNNALNKHI